MSFLYFFPIIKINAGKKFLHLYQFLLNQKKMPYLYPVEVRQSPLQGKGVFALEDIPAGVIFWTFSAENFIPVKGTDSAKENVAFTKEQFLQKCSNSEKSELQDMAKHGFYHCASDRFLLFRDGGEFTNHDKNNNTKVINFDSKNPHDLVGLTTTNIKKGEELTQRYEEYLSCDPNYADWAAEFVQKYNPDIIEFERIVLEEAKGNSTTL